MEGSLFKALLVGIASSVFGFFLLYLDSMIRHAEQTPTLLFDGGIGFIVVGGIIAILSGGILFLLWFPEFLSDLV